MKIDVKTLSADTAGSVELSDDIFGLEPRKDLLHRMVVYQLAKRRQGTHKVKERGEVAGTTKKRYRQKGTGGARHGNGKASQFRGGGNAHGPRPRDHDIELPKKIRRLALKHALSAKAGAGELVILDEAKSDAPKTKALVASFDKLSLRSVLVVDGTEPDKNFSLAARNIPHVDVLPVAGINVYDVLRRDTLVLTKSAVESLEARLK